MLHTEESHVRLMNAFSVIPPPKIERFHILQKGDDHFSALLQKADGTIGRCGICRNAASTGVLRGDEEICIPCISDSILCDKCGRTSDASLNTQDGN